VAILPFSCFSVEIVRVPISRKESGNPNKPKKYGFLVDCEITALYHRFIQKMLNVSEDDEAPHYLHGD